MKKQTDSFSVMFLRPKTARRPMAHARVRASRALPRALRHKLGLGREFGHAPSPTWAATLAQSISVVGSNRTAARRLRANEKRRRRLPSETLSHFLFCSLSLRRSALSLLSSVPPQQSPSERVGETMEQRAPAPSPAPSPACAFPSG